MTNAGPSSTDLVVVVGGGPSGLLVAGILASAGLSVTLLEASVDAPPGVRASTLHARAMEILDRHDVPGLSSLPRSGRGHYVGIPLDLSTAPSPWAGAWRCAQPDLVERLGRWSRARGVRIVHGGRVRAVEQDAGRVVARTGAGPGHRADLLVAADGARSPVRDLLGVPCVGPPATRSMVRADVVGGDLRGRRFERLGDLTLTCAPLDPRTTRVMVHDPAWPVGVDVTEDQLRTTWLGATGEHLPAAVEWIDTFSDTTSWVEDVVVGRTVFCGDAAHQFIPIGGVSLNSALIGAHVLALRIVEHLCDGQAWALAHHARDTAHRSEATAQRLRYEAGLLFGVRVEDRRARSEVADRLRDDEAFRDGVVRQVSGLARFDAPSPLAGRAAR